jgi:hypothetical protein
LSSLCSDSVSSACPETYIRTKITDFWSHCTDELTKKNVDVIKLYDTIYAIIPMRTSVCAKDDSGTYCVLASPGLGSSNISPTMSSYHDNNVPFLLYNPDLDANTLCTSCVRQVLTSYMTHESKVAYGPGLSNSQLLDKQPPFTKPSRPSAQRASWAVPSKPPVACRVEPSLARLSPQLYHNEPPCLLCWWVSPVWRCLSYSRVAGLLGCSYPLCLSYTFSFIRFLPNI